MKLSNSCIQCLIKRQEEAVQLIEDETIKDQYLIDVHNIINQASELDTAPIIIFKLNQLHQRYFGSSYSFEQLKIQYNTAMLQKEMPIWNKINSSKDKVLEALNYAKIGNYIDFGAMGNIDDAKLEELLASVPLETIDQKEYTQFREDLSHARSLVYLTDNCGEIVLDKLFIQVLLQQYPHLRITAIVRGKPVLNDATMTDAHFVELTKIVEVIGNGTEIAGTSLHHIDRDAKARIESADLIISKGQGNFETLHGCGLNIYYIFLCKCDWFVSRFQLERFKGVFINEKNQQIR